MATFFIELRTKNAELRTILSQARGSLLGAPNALGIGAASFASERAKI